MRLVLVLILALVGPDPGWAASGAAPMVEVIPDPGGASGRVRASMTIAARPEVVWSVMTNCARAGRITPRLLSCRVLQADPAGRWDVREHRLKGTWLTPAMTNVFRSDYDPPRGLSYRRTGGDFKRSEGSWRLTPVDGGAATLVRYEGLTALNAPVPDVLVRMVVRREIPEALAALRRESEAEQAARP